MTQPRRLRISTEDEIIEIELDLAKNKNSISCQLIDFFRLDHDSLECDGKVLLKLQPRF